MTSTNSNSLLVGLLGLLLGLGGGAIGSMLVVGGRPVERPAPVAEGGGPSDGETAAMLRELTHELRLLREAIEAGGAPRQETPASERTVAAPAPTDRLERAIERLAEVLPSQRAASARPTSAAGLGSSQLRSKNTELLRSVWSAEETVRARPYMFWSMRQIMERFGQPDGVGSEDGVHWNVYYRFDEETSVEFWFTDDMLTSIGTEHD